MTAVAQQVTVRGRWFPADVVLPGMPRPWNRCYVIVTDTDLHVFRKVSDTAEWTAAVRWAGTMLPDTDRVARNGFDVVTEHGLAVITLGSGCRCGAFGRWAGPTWSQTERARA